MCDIYLGDKHQFRTRNGIKWLGIPSMSCTEGILSVNNGAPHVDTVSAKLAFDYLSCFFLCLWVNRWTPNTWHRGREMLYFN